MFTWSGHIKIKIISYDARIAREKKSSPYILWSLPRKPSYNTDRYEENFASLKTIPVTPKIIISLSVKLKI